MFKTIILLHFYIWHGSSVINSIPYRNEYEYSVTSYVNTNLYMYELNDIINSILYIVYIYTFINSSELDSRITRWDFIYMYIYLYFVDIYILDSRYTRYESLHDIQFNSIYYRCKYSIYLESRVIRLLLYSIITYADLNDLYSINFILQLV